MNKAQRTDRIILLVLAVLAVALLAGVFFGGSGDKTAAVTRNDSELRYTDYNGKKIGILTGTNMEAESFKYFPDSEYLYFDGYPNICTALKNGVIDAFLADEPALKSIHASQPEIDYIKERLTQNRYSFAFRKNDPAEKKLRDQFNEFLSGLKEGSENEYAMVGFRCCNTLSENGSVARGICVYDDNHHLTDVVERTEIMRVPADGPICYKDEAGEWVAVEDNVPVSMNMWGFTPDYFAYSEEYFKEFLSDPKNIENLKAEFFIPLMVNKLINEGTATVEVLDTTSKWFGVTYAADREATVERIAKLVADGVYPEKLW